MKTKIISLIVLGCFFASNMYAQYSSQRERDVSPSGPIHPLVNYGMIRMNTNIDTIHYYQFYSLIIGGELPEPFRISAYFTRDVEQLTDTLHIPSSSLWYVYRYNEKNQLLYEFLLDSKNPLTGYMRTDYEYDDEGRMVKYVSKWIQPSGNPSERIERERILDYSTIQMTEKGYIFENIEYELDDEGRLTYIKYLDYEDVFVKYTDGKEYRKADCYYTYTDSSFTTFGYAILGNPDLWIENTIIFNENGNIKWDILSVSDDGIKWTTMRQKTEYVYSKDAEPYSDNYYVDKTNTIVYTNAGAIHIVTENVVTIQIFDLAGRLIKQQAVSAGENRISVSTSGLYIVKVGNESFKVSVR